MANHTLTALLRLHVGILPLGLIGLLIAHLVFFPSAGCDLGGEHRGLVTKPENDHGAELFWPRQAFYDMLACMVVFRHHVRAGSVWLRPCGRAPKTDDAVERGLYDTWARAGEMGKGADLVHPPIAIRPTIPPGLNGTSCFSSSFSSISPAIKS